MKGWILVTAIMFTTTSVTCQLHDSTFPKPKTQKQIIWRASKNIFVGQLATMWGISAFPQELTGWPDPFYKDAGKSYKRAFTKWPRWDPDPAYVNYILHPVAGAWYYNAVRSQGFSEWKSFLYGIAASTFFEYIVESIAEQPSIQDLIYTPIGGYFLGEASHILTMKMQRNGFRFIEKVVVTIINPTYVILHGFKNKRKLLPLQPHER